MADYVEGYESDGTTRDPDYWQQQQLDEMRRARQQQQRQYGQQQAQRAQQRMRDQTYNWCESPQGNHDCSIYK